jgi:hypothetical protein
MLIFFKMLRSRVCDSATQVRPVAACLFREKTMTVLVDIVQLEAEINRRLGIDPPVDGELSPTLAALAEVYAGMIFHHQREIDVEALPESVRAALALQPADSRRSGE